MLSTKITPQSLNTEEASKLWTALQARYRTTAAYHVSVVLIDSRLPVRPSLPVLTRGEKDRGVDAQPGANLPRILELRLPHQQSSALLGDELILLGENFDAALAVRISHQRLPEPLDIAPDGPPTSGEIKLTLRPASMVLADGTTVSAPLCGPCTASVVVERSGRKWTSNPWHLTLAPRVEQIVPSSPVRDADGNVSLTVKCSPHVKLAAVDAEAVRFDQQVELLFAEQPPVAPTAPQSQPATDPNRLGADTLVFNVRNPPRGKWLPRLRVDGVEMAPVEWPKPETPLKLPKFDTRNEVTIP